jgi:soluble lytic murein transglycosylase-like protein
VKPIAAAAIISVAMVLAPDAAHAEGRILVLSATDEAAYRSAFAAAEANRWERANEAVRDVADKTLIPALQARRLLSGIYNPPFEELAEWLSANADSPFAPEIYAMAQTRQPPGAAPPRPPAPLGRRSFPNAGAAPPGDNAPARAQIDAAAQAFADGDLAGATANAEAAAPGPRQGPAEWQLGLIAFRTRDYKAAAAHFDAASAWRYWDGWGAAASRYWAGRAHLAAGEGKLALARFKAATAYPATFYGQLAEAQLGLGSGLAFTPPTIDEQTALAFMTRHTEARRAAALAQIGRLSDVEMELRALHARIAPGEDRLFLDFADALSAPGAQLRAAEYGGANEAWGYCPTTTFAPEDGWRFDRAAVLAVTRQESRFSPVAVSRSNARGLMQILPSTAGDFDSSARANPDKLLDPNINLRIGQTYLEYLMRQSAPDGDLVKLFAAYNGGPGWLARWQAAQPDIKDPLMMLEALPRAESRDYAERVLSHMGLCRKRFGQEAVEFDRLAAGAVARYTPLDR